MVESHLKEGSHRFLKKNCADLEYGVSITDSIASAGKTTERMLRWAYETLDQRDCRRPKA